MPEFFFVVVSLSLLAAAFVIFPIMLNRSGPRQSRHETNIVLFRERLAELQNERDNNRLDEEEFQRLKTELERRLLEDAGDTGVSHAQVMILTKPRWQLILTLALSVPVAGWLLYQQTGAKADWDIAQTLRDISHIAAAEQDTSESAAKLVRQLNDRLQQRVDDPHYLSLLGNVELDMQNYPAATDAYQRLSALVPGDPNVLAQYAQALYLSSGRVVTPKVQSLAEQSLAINPRQPGVLGMLGIASFETGDYRAAIQYWERLLPALGPVSPNSKMIRGGIKQARMLLAERGDTEAIATLDSQAKAQGEAAAPARLNVDVAVAAGVKAEAGASVFVYARAVAGPRMPLAVARLKVSDLPARVVLDDSMAMAPGMKLSSFDRVEVIARISKNGIANRGSGDIEGLIGPIDVAAASAPLSVLISEVVP